MSNGRRPGGLTALAVFYFIFASLGIMGILGMVVALALVKSGALDISVEEASESPTGEPADGAEGEPRPPGDGPEGVAEPLDPTPEPPPDDPTEQMRQMQEMIEQQGPLMMLIKILLSAAVVVMQMIAGIGLMGQKRVMGRYLGNAYSILALIAVALTLVTLPPGLTSDWLLLSDTIIPVVSLVVLNTTFKDDLVF